MSFQFLRFKYLLIGSILSASVLCVAIDRALWAKRPDSAEAILEQADKDAWLNDWFGAAPLYARAEALFRKRGDSAHALYAHVSQIPPRIETSSLPALIREIDGYLTNPAASAPDVQLRILTVKGMAEINYDATAAKNTWSAVEKLANDQHHFLLASRASGEQGILAFLLGNIAEAKNRVVKAYAIAKYLRDRAARIRYAEVFGSGLVELRRYDEGLHWLDEAIDMAKKTPGVAQPTIAFNYKVDALSALGRYGQAQAVAEEALKYPRAHRLWGQLFAILTNRGQVFHRQGKWRLAIKDYTEAVGYTKRLTYWRGLTEVDGKLAKAYEQTDDLARASAAIDEALEANKRIPDELYFMPGNLAIKAEIEAKLGAKRRSRDLYLKSADIIDGMLANAPTPNIERILLSELGDVYSGHFALLSESGDYGDAFRVIERARGRVETQSLEHHDVTMPHQPAPEEKKLSNLQVLLLNTDDRRERQHILEEIYGIEVASNGKSIGAYAASEPVAISELKNELAPTELFIEYVLRSPKSYALAVTRSSVAVYTLPGRKLLEDQADGYRDTIHHKKADIKTAHHLFQELLGGIPEYKVKPDVIVVPDGELHLLPFSALADNDGRYAVATHTISMSPSGTVLTLLRSRSRAANGTMPYLGVAAWTQRTNSRPWILRYVPGTGPERSQLVPLPESKAEVESIATMLPKPSTVLLGTEATKDRFTQLPLNRYEVLHLALHGFADPEFPDRSALVFAPFDKNNVKDAGLLQAREIVKLHLNANLVTLSACNTGIGPVGQAGVDNLVEAFIQAGAQSVVSTLWELEDRSTAHLMKIFYDRLAHQEGKAEALRQAKLSLLNDGLSPYFWAGFQVVGDPSGTLFTRTINGTKSF
jgi:CHAT domain-containing protein